ncbi:MAG: DMT family transporter [Crocinitomicaceae bacterium]|nr:DMT family transporter [Crocinitomicaceae bacterium]MDC1195862.1 DMT family transporter [Crocinitomicaceae bacterium]MDC1384945.1 DMT family transporter [Crocinitomicaceae bacterium]|tara:strand:+ start:262 stop:1188 length:927 start_codon:yes stop_codon:yes gene_type:complete
MSKVLKAHIALFSVNALYGANHVIAKGVMPDYLTPSVFIFLRASGATLLFWIFKIIFVREKVQRKDLFLMALCGLFGVAMNQLFFFHGLSLTSPVNTGIIMTINPILVVVLSFFILKEAITLRRSVGILIGATGAVLLTLTAGTGIGDSSLGDFFIFINAASYALYLVLVKPLMGKYKPLTVITYVFSFGFIFVMLYPPTFMELSITNFSRIPMSMVFVIIYVVVGVTFLAYLLTVFGLKHVSPSATSAYIYLQPVLVMLFAVGLSALGMAEDYTGTITSEKIMYMILIFIGVYITSSKSFKKESLSQ